MSDFCRFFIDFPDLTQQHNKLFKFLDNHFHGKRTSLGHTIGDSVLYTKTYFWHIIMFLNT